MTTSADVAAAALDIVGTPYHHQARLPGPRGGLDCAGVVVCAHRAVGLEVHDDVRYSRIPNPRVLLAALEVDFVQVPPDQVRPGDVAVFWYRRRRGVPMPQHMGVLVEDGRMVHAYEDHDDAASFVHAINVDAGWQARRHSTWRHRALAEVA